MLLKDIKSYINKNYILLFTLTLWIILCPHMIFNNIRRCNHAYKQFKNLSSFQKRVILRQYILDFMYYCQRNIPINESVFLLSDDNVIISGSPNGCNYQRINYFLYPRKIVPVINGFITELTPNFLITVKKKKTLLLNLRNKRYKIIFSNKEYSLYRIEENSL